MHPFEIRHFQFAAECSTYSDELAVKIYKRGESSRSWVCFTCSKIWMLNIISIEEGQVSYSNACYQIICFLIVHILHNKYIMYYSQNNDLSLSKSSFVSFHIALRIGTSINVIIRSNKGIIADRFITRINKLNGISKILN